jgi:segregation and condensation protein B
MSRPKNSCGLDTLRDLPDFEALEDSGLLSKEKLLAGQVPTGLASERGDSEAEEPESAAVEDEMY